VADDHPIVLRGTRALIREIEGIEIVGEAENGKQAVQKNKEFAPDVILMDLVMPEMDGIEAIKVITEEQPDARILVLTSFITDDHVFPAIKAGALGFLLKDSQPEELIAAIRQVARGEPSLHPSIARKVLQELGSPKSEETIPDPLTDRETEVLTLLAQGYDNKQIADKLVIAEVTVRTHISRILDKLHLANRVQATLYALRKGITSISDSTDAEVD
jgi:NarL family two-component system response regulator LiaR